MTAATARPPTRALPDISCVAHDDVALIASLRAGDEAAFVVLVDRYHAALVRLAHTYVASEAVAEEVTQETWLAVLRGLDRFEGRSSLKTWIFHILANRAKTRAVRERRCIPFSALDGFGAEDDEPAVEPERFLPADHPRWPGHWATSPSDWGESGEERLLADETRACVQRAIDALPPNQRQVISLRDVEGWSSEEVCRVLGLSEGNQRVLLHRARSKVRRALELYLEGREVAG
jgi:RNA polymerase sigma-70 factor, ECF subfamily